MFFITHMTMPLVFLSTRLREARSSDELSVNSSTCFYPRAYARRDRVINYPLTISNLQSCLRERTHLRKITHSKILVVNNNLLILNIWRVARMFRHF